jgi:hypothetical protein
MIYTKITPYKSPINVLVKYISDLKKTENSSFLTTPFYKKLLYHRSKSGILTQHFVTGINCSPALAAEEMTTVRKKYCKTSGNAAYTFLQSFEEKTVSPAVAHRIGVETARKMLGDKYQIVVATHLNTNHTHNHIIINAVSFRDGSKFQDKMADYFRFINITNSVAREFGIIPNDSISESRVRALEYHLRKRGITPYFDVIREEIKDAISTAEDFEDFLLEINKYGYNVIPDSTGKQLYLNIEGYKGPLSTKSLGKEFSVESIRNQTERINRSLRSFLHRSIDKTGFPLIEIDRSLSDKGTTINSISLKFAEYCALMECNLTHNPVDLCRQPILRIGSVQYKDFRKCSDFLAENCIGITDFKEFETYAQKQQATYISLEKQFRSISNKIRRISKSHHEIDVNPLLSEKNRLKVITVRYRKILQIISKIIKYYPLIEKNLKLERKTETRDLLILKSREKVKPVRTRDFSTEL